MSGTEYKPSRGSFRIFKKSLPDIITDAPHRVEKEMPLPVVCFVKLNRPEPVKIESISVKILQNGRTMLTTTVLQHPVQIEEPLWQREFTLNIPDEVTGKFFMDVFVKIEFQGKFKTILNNSCRGLKNRPLEIYRAEEPLPRFKNFYFGDIHFHGYKSDEFYDNKHRLPASANIARSLGLDFYSVTLHSFNYDNSGRNVKRQWEKFNRDVEQCSRKNNIVILPGEEISCRNSRGRNIRMLALNGSEFVIGTGNSPLRRLPVRSEFKLQEAIKLTGPQAVTYALQSHTVKSGLRKLFSRIGKWRKTDLEANGLTGMQIYNIVDSSPDNTGMGVWIDLLLKGKKRFIVAGSHASGSLNPQILKRSPFSGEQKNSNLIFGSIRTGIFTGKPLDKEAVISCLKNGSAIVTNGPVLNFKVQNNNGGSSRIGGELSGEDFLVKFNARSTAEFGPLKRLIFYAGDISARKEELIFTFNFQKQKFAKRQEFAFEPRGDFGYIRGELWSGDGENSRFCYTNPIWIRELKSIPA